MNNNKSAHDIAKQMIIDGESFDKIKEVTNLRLKEIKRIQRDEINPNFNFNNKKSNLKLSWIFLLYIFKH